MWCILFSGRRSRNLNIVDLRLIKTKMLSPNQSTCIKGNLISRSLVCQSWEFYLFNESLVGFHVNPVIWVIGWNYVEQKYCFYNIYREKSRVLSLKTGGTDNIWSATHPCNLILDHWISVSDIFPVIWLESCILHSCICFSENFETK